MIALLSENHPLSAEKELELGALSASGFLFFPRELAPRLHDFMVGVCRRAGFEPVARSESFHSGWELQILADIDVVALAPASVAPALPTGVVARLVSDPPDQLETALVWRADDSSPVNLAFRQAAQATFAASGGGLSRRCGELDWSGQVSACVPLQRSDLMAQRRLGDMQALRGRTEVKLLGDRDEVLHQP